LYPFARTEALLGAVNMKKLENARVAVFGIGGVGGYATEALARCGIGTIDLIDNDVVSETNLNRQIVALTSTMGQYKVDVMQTRILDINPSAKVQAHRRYYGPETEQEFDFRSYDYIVDAIDSVSSKILLISNAKLADTPIISCMGAGNKLDPTKFEVADISKTSVCPLAKVIRKELRQRGIEHLKVVYSKESPLQPNHADLDLSRTGRGLPGSISFSPSAAGLILASEVIKDLLFTD